MAANRCREPLDLTKEDVDRLTDALKDEEFRKLLAEYCEETQSPEARANYQKEFTELEKQRGYLVTFITPNPGYVVKSSVAGDQKAFINICSSDTIAKPTYHRAESAGMNWSLPYSLAPPRDDYDKSKNRCVVYDVVFHPNTLHIASKNTSFKSMLNQTAFEAVENNHKVILDKNNVKYPKLEYKGPVVPSIIRKPDPDFKENVPSDNQELLDQLYPQKNYFVDESKPTKTYIDNNDSDYTIPKYKLKHRREVDMKEYTYERDAKKHSAIPSHLVLEINLPLLSSSADALLNIKDKNFSLISEKPSRYKLNLTLPYNVNDEAGSAKYDLSKRVMIVTLPVVPEEIETAWCYQREDSGVESDLNSPCGSDEDSGTMPALVTVLSETPGIEIVSESENYRTNVDNEFFDASLTYLVPPHSSSVFDNLLVLTLDVKNVDSESITVEDLPHRDGVRMKFDSIGAGFFSMHHGMILKVPQGAKCGQVFPEVWDNNVVLQIEITETESMDHYTIGLCESDMIKYNLKIPIRNNNKQIDFNKLKNVDFLQDDVFYSLPPYTMNVIDDMMAFTFKIRNVKADSFAVQKISNDEGYHMKFSSSDTDNNLKHYSLYLKFPRSVDCSEPSFNVFNENAILRLEISDSSMPDHIMIGTDANDLTKENLDVLEDHTQFAKSENDDEDDMNSSIEVTTKGRNETSIIMSRNEKEFSRTGASNIKIIPKKRNETYDGGICSSSGSFKGILKYKNNRIERSLSESNVDLMDYNGSPSYSLSSADCIPEESMSLKKTVRFSDVIAKQTFRSNSSILGQKSKNQRKKRNKKRAIDRRTSEGDNDDALEEVFLENGNRSFDDKNMKLNGHRRDSGLADTDEGDSDKGDGDNVSRDENPNDDKSSQFSHYNRKDQGKYPGVNFKNDLIFDLDM